MSDDLVELGRDIRASGVATTTPDKSQLGGWDPEWSGADGISFFLYLPALVVAAWIAWERRRLDWDRAAGAATRQVPQCVPRSLTLFADLLVLSFFLRALWFFARATNLLGARSRVADTCVVGFDCRERIAESILDRVGQLFHFAAFSLIVTYWDWWTTTLSGEEGSAGGEVGAEEGGRVRPRRRCLDGVFLVLDVWLFLIQVVLMPLRFAVPFAQSAIVFMDLGYWWQIAVLYAVVGVLLITRGAAVHAGLRGTIADQRRWLTTVLSAGGGESTRQRRGPGLSSPLQLQRLLSPRERVSAAEGARGGAADAMEAGGLAVRRAREALSDWSETMSPVTTLALGASAEDSPAVAEDPSMRLLLKAEWRVVVLAYVCGPLLLVKSVFFVLAPLRVRIAPWAEAAAYPWLLYTVPDLLAGVATLALTAPHGVGSGSGALFGIAARAAAHGADAFLALRACDCDRFCSSLVRAVAAVVCRAGCATVCSTGTGSGGMGVSGAAGAAAARVAPPAPSPILSPASAAGAQQQQQQQQQPRSPSQTLRVLAQTLGCCARACCSADQEPPAAMDPRLAADVYDALAADDKPRWRAVDAPHLPASAPRDPQPRLLAPQPAADAQARAVARLLDAQQPLVVGDVDIPAAHDAARRARRPARSGPLPWTAKGVWI